MGTKLNPAAVAAAALLLDQMDDFMFSHLAEAGVEPSNMLNNPGFLFFQLLSAVRGLDVGSLKNRKIIKLSTTAVIRTVLFPRTAALFKSRAWTRLSFGREVEADDLTKLYDDGLAYSVSQQVAPHFINHLRTAREAMQAFDLLLFPDAASEYRGTEQPPSPKTGQLGARAQKEGEEQPDEQDSTRSQRRGNSAG